MEHETGGDCNARGSSGEVGCMQYLPSTWRKWSFDVLGYIPKMTKTNELYVATGKIQSWLDRGYTVEECALIWNSGGAVHRIGVNKYGIAYNTYDYVNAILAKLN